MKLDITEIMNKRKSELSFSFGFMPDESEDFALLPEGLCFNTEAQVDVRCTDVNGYIKLVFDIDVDLLARCDRCLDEFTLPLHVTFDRFASQSRNAVFTEDSEEEILEIRDSAVYPDRDIMEEISLAAPEYVLCSDDCPGLCTRCGRKIGFGCSCGEIKEEKVTDHRMDVFRDLLKKMEENEKNGEDDTVNHENG